jgi:AraC family transcriptional regulator, arabinose operon regulatory protein
MDLRIQLVISMLESELGSGVRIVDLAESVNLSPSRLRHLFRAETGQTLVRYRKRARLDRAQLLLRTTLLSVKEIMHQVGLGSDSHFTHDFKEAFGLSPTRYRMRWQESSQSIEISRPSQFGQRTAISD